MSDIRSGKRSKMNPSPLAIRRIIQTIKRINRADRSKGASIDDILESLHSKKQLLKYDHYLLERTIRNEVKKGVIRVLPNGNFFMPYKRELQQAKNFKQDVVEIRRQITDLEVKNRNLTPAATANHNSNDTSKCSTGKSTKRKGSVSFDNDTEFKRQHTPTTRVRPVSQRKKIKKSLGSDFLDPSDLGLQYLNDCYDPKCYFCGQIVSSIKQEKFVGCSKCESKAHHACLKGDVQLNGSPWFCFKCRAVCYACGKPPESETLVYCGHCNNGYHATCPGIDLKAKELTCEKCKTIGEIFDVIFDTVKESEDDKNGNNNVNQLRQNVTNNGSKRNAKNETTPIISLPRSNSDSGNFLNGLTNNERSLQKSQITKSATDLVQPNNLPTSGRRMKDDKASKQRQSDWIVGKDWIYPNIVPYIDSRNGLTDLPSEWTIDEVEAYISTIGFPDQAHVFREEEIDGRSLLLLKRTDVLKGLPLKLGPALKIYAHIHQLQAIEYFRSNPKINNAKKDPEEAPRDEQETAIQAEVTSTTTTAVSQ